ncbi:MAG: VTT domain-containing protein [Acetobacter aceti]|uniref:TVP38/TMEM64 family protein n=1 Tax=Acetobacter aceti TaxID=435 RepID=UPI00098AE062|nr:VTT domain-containing protein [Acetobacter aceti]
MSGSVLSRRSALLATVLGVLVIAGTATGLILRHDTEIVTHFVAWVNALRSHSPIAGWLICAGVQTLVALCGFLPASVGAIASGMIFGLIDGFILSGTATLIGALGAFCLSRSFLRGPIHAWLRRGRFMAILDDTALTYGWKLVCLLRVSPVMPFAVTSYALGLTPLSMRNYLIGTLAALPSLFGYVAMGQLAVSGATTMGKGAGWLHDGMIAIALLGTVLLLWQFGSVARRFLAVPVTIDPKSLPAADATVRNEAGIR